jgi:steroid delta-isomerase-like uncharacterized protein
MSASRTRRAWFLALGLAAFVAAACQPPAPAAPDYAAVQQPPIEAFLDAWNNGNVDGLDAVLSPDIQRRSPGGTSDANGLAELKEVVNTFRATYPDFRVEVTETYHLENLAIGHWTATGTNTGPGDIPPTGKAVRISGISMLRYIDGKITEELVYYDSADWMTQLGYTIEPPVAE